MEARNKCKTVFRNAADGRHQPAHGCDHGHPARFRSPGAIANYVGVAIRLQQSGKKRFFSDTLTVPSATARLREALWMVVCNAVRRNPWLSQCYERRRAAGKPVKVTVIPATRKLLAAAWSTATRRRSFVPPPFSNPRAPSRAILDALHGI